jgi:hypothetical protein
MNLLRNTKPEPETINSDMANNKKIGQRSHAIEINRNPNGRTPIQEAGVLPTPMLVLPHRLFI